MHDVKWIRENPAEFDQKLSYRSIEPSSKKILTLDEEQRALMSEIQSIQQKRNENSKKLSSLDDKTSKSFELIRKEGELLKKTLEQLEARQANDFRLKEILETLPNLPAGDVPKGKNESDNIEIRKFGETISVPYAREHFELGESLGMMDFAASAKISGSRFVTLRSDLARLERAIASFMIDTHVRKFGFTEVSPPYLVRDSAMYGAGQLPKFSEESFYTKDGYRLIPTAEVPLVSMFSDSIIAREKLPLRLVAYTPCFRSEAGAAGRDTRGMIRLHQFSKVELVSITADDESDSEHEYITSAAETILQKLDLPYRVMLLCAGDMGFSAKKTYDLEVWLPGQKKYREISSCSNCGDFQARRMKARFKEFGQKNTKFVHTLNGSGLAVGRTLVAILENYQNEDGSITVPNALVSYMGGRTIIRKEQ
ncbi:MAG: serine--tRNA ligase [Rickettsiaceae bacterium]|nr:serine--tRNA ligase [Rickettsiaceae bacterium]